MITLSKARQNALYADTVVNVKDFGAVGDDSNDDTAEIQAALDSGAKRVFIPAGTYKITTALSLPSNIEVYGEGEGSVIKLYANSDVLQINGTSNISLHDFSINGQRATYTTATNDGIYINWISTAGENVRIRNVNVTEMGGVGILGLASSGTASSGVTVEGCLVENTGAHSIVFQDYISDVLIRRNTVKYSGLGYADRPGITASRYGRRVIVSDNIVIGSASALGSSVHGISIDGTEDAVCHGNVVSGWIGYGIEVGGVTNGSFQGNTVTGCTRASIALSGSNGTIRNINVSVVGNTCNSNTAQGIYAFMAGGVATYMHQNIVIANNAVNGTTAGVGIEVGLVDRLNINGNSVYGASLSGIYALDCKRVMIAGNNVTYNNCTAVKSVTSLTLSGSTATATSAGHGYANSDLVTIFGASPVDYNGTYVVSNVTTDTFDYTAISGLLSPAVGTIECTKYNSASQAGIRLVWSTITTKETVVFGQNLVERNGFRDVYDVSANGFIGFVNGMLFLPEAKGPRVENLTSGAASNIEDRMAIYMKNDKIAIAYNNAGTANYAVLDLDGSDTTWANSSTAP